MQHVYGQKLAFSGVFKLAFLRPEFRRISEHLWQPKRTVIFSGFPVNKAASFPAIIIGKLVNLYQKVPRRTLFIQKP